MWWWLYKFYLSGPGFSFSFFILYLNSQYDVHLKVYVALQHGWNSSPILCSFDDSLISRTNLIADCWINNNQLTDLKVKEIITLMKMTFCCISFRHAFSHRLKQIIKRWIIDSLKNWLQISMSRTWWIEGIPIKLN